MEEEKVTEKVMKCGVCSYVWRCRSARKRITCPNCGYTNFIATDGSVRAPVRKRL